jgi:hypothetical protein
MNIALIRPGVIGLAINSQAMMSGAYTECKWSGIKYPFPPQIGERVTVKFNGFGDGTVIDYFISDGYLGVLVKVDQQPNWHIKQGGTNPIRAFGIEID